jgi:uncharacterized membrane protein YkoI
MRLVATRVAIWALAAAILMIAPQAMAECLPWKAAGPLIAKNGLVPANKVYKAVQTRTGGKILNASLCENNGRYVYKFSVLGPKGDVTNHNIDAKTGQF